MFPPGQNQELSLVLTKDPVRSRFAAWREHGAKCGHVAPSLEPGRIKANPSQQCVLAGCCSALLT